MTRPLEIGTIKERWGPAGAQKYIKVKQPNKWKRYYDWKNETFECYICHKEVRRSFKNQKFCLGLKCSKRRRIGICKAYRDSHTEQGRLYARRRNAYLKESEPLIVIRR